MEGAAVTRPHESITRRGVIRGFLVVVPLLLYFGIYVWARCTGLFAGEVETWAPFGRKPTNQYSVGPIGWRAMAVLPVDSRSAEENVRLWKELGDDQENSRRLWPWYSWLAAVEEKCRYRPQRESAPLK